MATLAQPVAEHGAEDYREATEEAAAEVRYIRSMYTTTNALVDVYGDRAKPASDPFRSIPHELVPFLPLQLQVTYQSLEVLQEHGIAANDIQKLNNAGELVVCRSELHATECTSLLIHPFFFFLVLSFTGYHTIESVRIHILLSFAHVETFVSYLVIIIVVVDFLSASFFRLRTLRFASCPTSRAFRKPK